jgi:hypothetical protein
MSWNRISSIYILSEYSIEQNNEHVPSRLSFNEKLAAHRSNRLNETFGQANAEKETNDETLVPSRCKIPHNSSN